jgi:hypothetical protein
MSDITANIVISPIDLGVLVTTNQLSITPEAINLNFYSGAVGTPGGAVTQIQYNAGGILGGTSNLTYSGGVTTVSNVNVSTYANLGTVANVEILGGVNGYVLQTDGTGNLSWTAQSGGGGGNGVPGGANTQVQFNDAGAFGGDPGFVWSTFAGPNLIIAGNVIATNFFGIATSAIVANTANAVTGGNVSGQVANALIAGTVYTAAQPNITSVGILTSANVTGNLKAGNLIGPHANGTSNVNIPAVNGNINLTAAGNTTLVITGTGANITGTANVSGNLSAGNANLGNLVVANYFSGNGSLLTGIISVSSNFANYAGNVTVAAQPNITSVGNLLDLRVLNTAIHLGTNSNAVAGAIAIGYNSTANTASGTAIGNAANAINANSIAFGTQAFAGLNGISIGTAAGLGKSNTAVAGSIAIGYAAGQGGPGYKSIAIGFEAANSSQGNHGIAIGSSAGDVSQGATSIAIGLLAANNAQGANSIAIGYRAGGNTQGANAIAIGRYAGNNSQSVNSIILNASGAILDSTQADSLFVKPIRDVTGNVDFTKTLKYNPTTGEIGYV